MVQSPKPRSDNTNLLDVVGVLLSCGLIRQKNLCDHSLTALLVTLARLLAFLWTGYGLNSERISDGMDGLLAYSVSQFNNIIDLIVIV